MSDWDGLRLCENCRDAYTLGTLCRACDEQEMIDRSDYVPLICPKCRSYDCYGVNDEFTKFECQKCNHQWSENKSGA